MLDDGVLHRFIKRNEYIKKTNRYVLFRYEGLHRLICVFEKKLPFTFRGPHSAFELNVGLQQGMQKKKKCRWGRRTGHAAANCCPIRAISRVVVRSALHSELK